VHYPSIQEVKTLPYRFVDDIATADCAVSIDAESLNGLFQDAAYALIETMTPRSAIKRTESWKIELEEENLERLLYAWLSELVFVKDSENVLFGEFAVGINRDANACRLEAEVKGEHIDHSRHDIGVDVKAITMHMLKVDQKSDGWSAFVIFDL
jgi:SHS2 domain-containing protein